MTAVTWTMEVVSHPCPCCCSHQRTQACSVGVNAVAVFGLKAGRMHGLTTPWLQACKASGEGDSQVPMWEAGESSGDSGRAAPCSPAL